MKPILVSCPRYWAKVRGYKLHERFISYMSLNQNSICDANCPGCFRYQNRKNGLENLLEMPDYQRLLNEFHQHDGLAVEISGEGEPLMSLNVLPIIRLATKLGLYTTLITNAHLLNQELIKELKDLNVALVISLHSLSKNIYERDYGSPDSFSIKIKNIDLASKIFENTEWQENNHIVKRLAIHWTLQADNINKVDNARQFCNNRNILLSVSPIARIGQASQHPELWLFDEERSVAEAEEMADESIILYDEPNGRKLCATSRYGLNIGADGNLLLDAHGGYEVNIANICKISFEKAIHLQHYLSQKMFNDLDGFCPLRHPKWNDFIRQINKNTNIQAIQRSDNS